MKAVARMTQTPAADNVRADWRHAGVEPRSRSRVQPEGKGAALGPAQASEGSMKDAFDLWWEWAQKPLDSGLMIPAELHDAVMALTPDDRRDRAKVNAAARQAEREA